MRRGRAAAIVALCVLVALAGAFIAGRASAAATSPAARWALYVEKLKPDGKLVVLTAEHRYAASREFAAKLLAIVNLRASIAVSAWADVAYYLDVTDPKRWTVSWDARRRAVTVAAPEPDCMPPAVRTDTIEVSAKGANLVTNMAFRLKDEARLFEVATAGRKSLLQQLLGGLGFDAASAFAFLAAKWPSLKG